MNAGINFCAMVALRTASYKKTIYKIRYGEGGGGRGRSDNKSKRPTNKNNNLNYIVTLVIVIKNAQGL